MALTAFERQIAKRYIAYYSGRGSIDDVMDDEKILSFMNGDETSRRELLKTFVTDILLSREHQSISEYQDTLQEVIKRAAVLSAYVSV
jgi:hypothetical protein